MQHEPITTKPSGPVTTAWWSNTQSYETKNANSRYCYRLYAPSAAAGRPHHWWGCEMAQDTMGREWNRSIRAVVDNFGNLVEVPA